jgi:hypothetical protein
VRDYDSLDIWRKVEREHESETYYTNLLSAIDDHEATTVTVVVSTCLVYYFAGIYFNNPGNRR